MNEEYDNNMDSVSLDNRKVQLTQKVEQLSGLEKSDTLSSPYDKQEQAELPQSYTESVYREKVGKNVQNTVANTVPSMAAPVNPPINHAVQSSYSQPINNTIETQPANPYVMPVSVNDYTQGMAVPKHKVSGGLKVYLMVIIGLCVIFLGMFIFECVRTYDENGLFGGDLDRFLGSDNVFEFTYPDSTDSDEDEEESDLDTNTDTSVGDETVRKPAPGDDSLLSSDASEKLEAKNQPADIDSAEYSARKAFKKVENSVVNIVIYDGEIGNDSRKTGTGSGIILTENGYIATNSHVIDDSKSTLAVVILNNGEEYIASIVGIDVRTDLAVLKIDAQNLNPVEFVNSDEIEVGQDAIAVGSPGGVKYSNSLTRGCVSALNRTVKSNALVPYIQTDAAINPGNSGGPLLNSAGQVMGINTIKIANEDYEGMGFAIPSNTVLSITKDIIKQGYVSGRVRIGITGTTVSSITAPAGAPEGVLVLSITDDSPLKGTTLKANDIITAVNGETIDGMPALYSELNKYQPGDEITLSVTRISAVSSGMEDFNVTIVLIADNGETQY